MNDLFHKKDLAVLLSLVTFSLFVSTIVVEAKTNEKIAQEIQSEKMIMIYANEKKSNLYLERKQNEIALNLQNQKHAKKKRIADLNLQKEVEIARLLKIEEERLEAKRLEDERIKNEARALLLAQEKAAKTEKEENTKENNETSQTVATVSNQTSDASGSYIGSFQATSYAVGAWGVPGTVTANGTDISNSIYTPDGYRIIAVDPNVIPLNSLVRVEVPGQASFVARAADTGGMIKGNIIDILLSTPEECTLFGRQNGIKIYRVN